ncbi:MAG: hypothetical protein EON60_01930 [Alphaproteobacteria bacterium]|nr:MAG: hypothetical protein EON60_01930 [Alphaproteobacteria bacterium]
MTREPAFSLKRILPRLVPTLKHGMGQLLMQSIAMALPLLLLPVLTRYMPPEEYGRLALYTLVLSLMIPLMLAGAEHLLTYSYFKRDEAGKRRLIVSSFALAGALSLTIVLLAAVFMPFLQAQLELGPTVILSMGVVAGLTCIFTLAQVVAFMERSLALQSVFITGRVVLAYVLGVSLLALGIMDWRAMVAGQFFAAVVLAAVGLIYLQRKGLLGWHGSLRDVVEIPRVGGLMALFSLSGILVALVDRLMINHFIGAHGVGIYAVPAALMTGVMLLILAMTRAVSPQAIKIMSEGGDVALRRKVIYIYSAFWGIAVLAFGVAAVVGQPALRLLTDGAYHEASVLIVPLAVAMLFNTCFVWNATLLMFERRGGVLVVIALLGALTDAALGSVLIPAYGLVGAGWANAGAYALMAILGFGALLIYVQLPWRMTLTEARRIMLGLMLVRGVR